MFIAILKAFLIGICASVPLGPCAILILQKSLSYGHKPGFVTGLGATTVDTLWATVSVFALSLAEEFINNNDNLIYFIGGLIVTSLGVNMALSNPFKKYNPKEEAKEVSIKYYFQAFLTAFTNPAAIFVMIGLFAFFNVETPDRTILVLPIIAGVCAGSVFYWYNFSWAFSHLRHSLKVNTLVFINKLAGIVIACLGLSVFIKGFGNMFIR